MVTVSVTFGFDHTNDFGNHFRNAAPAQNQNRAECGHSVAISGNKAVFGCPGANSNSGKAYVFNLNLLLPTELVATVTGGQFFGASVAIYSSEMVVSSLGGVAFFRENVDGLTFRYIGTILGLPAESAAADGSSAIVGLPRTGAGRAVIWTTDSSGVPDTSTNL
jgi:hypothetical protein